MLIGGNGEQFLVVHERDVDNPHADAQVFHASTGILLDQIKPLGIWLKFMYYMEGIIPPVAFTPEEAQQRVRTYQAAKRAREEAEGE